MDLLVEGWKVWIEEWNIYLNWYSVTILKVPCRIQTCDVNSHTLSGEVRYLQIWSCNWLGMRGLGRILKIFTSNRSKIVSYSSAFFSPSVCHFHLGSCTHDFWNVFYFVMYILQQSTYVENRNGRKKYFKVLLYPKTSSELVWNFSLQALLHNTKQQLIDFDFLRIS